MKEDAELLRRFVTQSDDNAFRELVQRHVAFVYSSALRQLNGDVHLAADVTQLVFTDLARKARTLTQRPILAGWLFTSTRFAAGKLVRGEQRRRTREQEAQLMQELSNDPETPLDWSRVRPILDVTLAELAESDREAILLRFFEHLDYREIGSRLRVPDNTVRMRVERALDKLRIGLERRGVTSTGVALAAALGTDAVVAAPAGLAASVAGAALAGGGTASLWITFMSMNKLQVGLTGALALAGATGLVLEARTNAALQNEAANLRAEAGISASVRNENLQLARTAAEVSALRSENADFARMTNETADLKARLNTVARLQAVKVSTNSADETYDISKLDHLPQVISRKAPKYPAELHKAGIEGQAMVDFIVDKNGTVQQAVAVKSSREEFATAAVEAVSEWKFEAGQKSGRAVNTHMQVPIAFTLNHPAGASGEPVPVPHSEPPKT
jgi:RNA polymerase sigma factor (sigma-70 family)